MYQNLNILCTICARAGSKGIPNKNKIIVEGKPLIQYTLDIAKECDYFDNIFISTDDDDIIKIGKNLGFDIPFKRPPELSNDTASKIDVIQHATLEAEKYFNKSFDIIVDLSVTSPLRTVQDIKEAIELLFNSNASNVFSVTESSHNPYFCVVEKNNDKINLVKKLNKPLTRRQDAPITYDMNGSIYVWKKDALFSENPLFNDKTNIYIMPKYRSIDIDDLYDLILFELHIQNWDKIYFNHGYKNYWEKRVNINDTNDKTTTNFVFDLIFKDFFTFSPQNNNNLLDLGCGYGRFFDIFNEYNLNVYGIDISFEMINYAHQLYPGKFKELKVASATKIDYPDAFFDLIVAFAIFDATQQDLVLKEIARLLNLNGIALITGKNFNYHENDELAKEAEIKAKQKKHPNYFTIYDEMVNFLNQLGCTVIKEYFFEYRNDFSNLKYTNTKPNKFYEWCIFIKKTENTINTKLARNFFYKDHSANFLENYNEK